MRTQMARTLPGRQLGGTAAQHAVASHVVHVAVAAIIQPAQQVLLIVREVQFSDAQGVKTQFLGQGLEAGCGSPPGRGVQTWSGRAWRAQYNEPMALPIAVYSAEQVRALDQRAIESLPISGYTLMKRAGEAALRYLRARWPMANCGSSSSAAAATTAVTATCSRALPRPRAWKSASSRPRPLRD